MTGPEQAAPKKRELYIDAFRGVMALVMVQGHVFERLLSPEARADALYQFQLVFHGSTAPGFLFASGFVAGLPRAPLSWTATLRRARRLLFVLAVGYYLHLPYLSYWKIANEATPKQLARLFACDALQVIAVAQLLVIVLQWLFRTRWVHAACVLTLVVIASSPGVWAAGWSGALHPALGSYLDRSTGSEFPFFPYAAFVLGGTVAGAAVGRQDPTTRHRRAVAGGLALVGLGGLMALLLHGRVDFWSGASPAYTLVRLGGLLLLLRAVEALAARERPGLPALALLGHETLQVYVLHLQLLHGSVVQAHAPLRPLWGTLGFAETAAVLVAMLPVLLAGAWLWHRAKVRAPREAQLALVFLGLWFAWELFARPW